MPSLYAVMSGADDQGRPARERRIAADAAIVTALDRLWCETEECPSRDVASAYDVLDSLIEAALAMSAYDIAVENGADDSLWHVKFGALNNAAAAYAAWRPAPATVTSGDSGGE